MFCPELAGIAGISVPRGVIPIAYLRHSQTSGQRFTQKGRNSRAMSLFVVKTAASASSCDIHGEKEVV